MSVQHVLGYRCRACGAETEGTDDWPAKACWRCTEPLERLPRQDGWRCDRCMTVWLGKLGRPEHTCAGVSERVRTQQQGQTKTWAQTLIDREYARRAREHGPLGRHRQRATEARHRRPIRTRGGIMSTELAVWEMTSRERKSGSRSYVRSARSWAGTTTRITRSWRSSSSVGRRG